MTPRTKTVEERYGELRRMPISIVAGAEDQIVDVEQQSVRLHRALPHSDLHIVPGLGHMVHHGAPEAVAGAIEAVAAAARPSAVGILAPVPGGTTMAALPELA